MSVRMMSLVWEMDLPTSEKMVLLVIADHADDDGENAWPSMATIARKASVSERQAQRLVKSLASSGFLSVEDQAGGRRDMRNDRRPNRYTVHLNGVTSTTPREPQRGDTEAPRGDTGDANGVTPTSPKPSIEPSLEPPFDIDRHRFAINYFDQFWAVYPRKAAKQAAFAAFKKACQREEPLTIIAGARRYADDPNREDAFTAHAATWLNQGRWEDDPLPARSGSGTRAYVEASAALEARNPYLELGARNEPF